ncbi:MAG: lipid A biosynthesis acyltransferase [Chitinophagaceae bacterium]|nr:lipid A biosynthesis acyltransferase [Chitinophagaceae bacterium]MBK9939926.1 lipid A biosynthesis acyltransferase [Chitinophagaceae bacterium]
MYYVVYGFLWLVSLLPFRVLYFLSDCMYGLMFYVFKYRKEVVLSNLAIAFPEKSEQERRDIAKKFYHNFLDAFVESIKFISISKLQIQKRSTCDFDLINQLSAKGYDVHIMAGHQFNWEFGNALAAINLTAPFVGIYMPISNKSMDRIFYNFRKRFGTILISATEFKKNANHPAFSSQYTFGLAADQNPGHPSNAYWMNFFGKPVPFVTGPAKGAVRNNTAVVIVGFKKIKRGSYHFSAKLLTENGSSFLPETLTVMYKNALEEIIRSDPSNYLWSHRRWKYEWKPEYGPIIA